MTPRQPSNYDHLAALEHLLAEQPAIDAYADDWAEGFAEGTSQGRGSVGGHSDPVSSAVIAPDLPCRTCGEETPCANHPDSRDNQVWARREGHGIADQLHDVLLDLDAAKTLIRRAWSTWCRLRPQDHVVAELKQRNLAERSIGVGRCQVTGCTVNCTGGVNDRRKTGMCPRHYTAWRRNLASSAPLDRTEFLRHAEHDEGNREHDETAGMSDCG